MLRVVPHGEQDGGILIFSLILLEIKSMRTLMKNNDRGGQSRKNATSAGSESITHTFISSVNSWFLTGFFKGRHEVSALQQAASFHSVWISHWNWVKRWAMECVFVCLFGGIIKMRMGRGRNLAWWKGSPAQNLSGSLITSPNEVKE